MKTRLLAAIFVLLCSTSGFANEFTDVADDPPKHVGKTYSVMAWISPNTIRRQKLENVTGQAKVHFDGFMIRLIDGEKEERKGEKMGKGTFLYSGRDNINPVVDKDYGRKLKDALDPDKSYHVKVTFTVVKVIQEDIASFEYYFAVISKIEFGK